MSPEPVLEALPKGDSFSFQTDILVAIQAAGKLIGVRKCDRRKSQ